MSQGDNYLQHKNKLHKYMLNTVNTHQHALIIKVKDKLEVALRDDTVYRFHLILYKHVPDKNKQEL